MYREVGTYTGAIGQLLLFTCTKGASCRPLTSSLMPSSLKSGPTLARISPPPVLSKTLPKDGKIIRAYAKIPQVVRRLESEDAPGALMIYQSFGGTPEHRRIITSEVTLSILKLGDPAQLIARVVSLTRVTMGG